MDRPRLHPPSPHPVSIVIPTLNQEGSLARLLASLADVTRPLDLIVVDGHSDDGTCELVERFARRAPAHIAARLLTSPVHSLAAQRNQGAHRARHELLLFLDPDVLIANRDVDALIECFRARPCAAASCRLRPIEPDGGSSIHLAWLFALLRAPLAWQPFLGACILTTREVFRRIGGFDPRLRTGQEDNFCRKAACLGPFRILPVTIRVVTPRIGVAASAPGRGGPLSRTS